MTIRMRMLAVQGGAAVLLLSTAFVAGCNSKGGEAPALTPPTSTSLPGGPTGGPGGRMGGPGGPASGAPLAAGASGEQIFQAKCGCHGPGGKGGKAPVLAGGAGKSDADLFKTIHDGKGKMPSFASQLSDEQIKKVVTTLKGFK